MNRPIAAMIGALIWSAAFAPTASTATTRTHYIAADEVVWNYAPAGRDLISGGPLPPLPKLTLGTRYRKVIYREYTDGSFAKRRLRASADAYMGLLGPTIHAEVGDTIVVVFKNNARIPASIAAGPLSANPSGPVPPGGVRRYVWNVTERAGPGPTDGSSIAWRYYSTVDENRDENTGMIGTLVVTKRGAAKADGSPADVDREVFSLFSEIDESQSRMIETNLADPKLNPHHVKPQPGFRFSNAFFTIDGYIFGNMPVLTIHKGERTRWYVVVTRSDFDAHTPHWHGQSVTAGGMRTDTINIQVDETRVVDMVPDNPGVWLFHCHLAGHLEGGMEARFAVLP